MKKTSYSKTMMMITGILAAVIILFSQSVGSQFKDKSEKAKTEQKAEKKGETFISAPVVTPHSVALQQDQELPAPDKSFSVKEILPQKLVIDPEVATRYFKILFRAIISPNAP